MYGYGVFLEWFVSYMRGRLEDCDQRMNGASWTRGADPEWLAAQLSKAVDDLRDKLEEHRRDGEPITDSHRRMFAYKAADVANMAAILADVVAHQDRKDKYDNRIPRMSSAKSV